MLSRYLSYSLRMTGVASQDRKAAEHRPTAQPQRQLLLHPALGAIRAAVSKLIGEEEEEEEEEKPSKYKVRLEDNAEFVYYLTF